MQTSVCAVKARCFQSPTLANRTLEHTSDHMYEDTTDCLFEAQQSRHHFCLLHRSRHGRRRWGRKGKPGWDGCCFFLYQLGSERGGCGEVGREGGGHVADILERYDKSRPPDLALSMPGVERGTGVDLFSYLVPVIRQGGNVVSTRHLLQLSRYTELRLQQR